MSIPRDRGPEILEHVTASGITLIEWETTLIIRLNYPHAPNEASQRGNKALYPANILPQSRFVLVPDDQIPKVQEAVAELGFSPAGEDILPSQYACERLGPALRYHLAGPCDPAPGGRPQCRLVFVPVSYTGLRMDEVVPILEDDRLRPALPPSTMTVPLPAACAALARIACRTDGPTATRTHKSSMILQAQLVDHISGIVTYSLFDMSYEGDYMVHLPNSVPLSDAEVLEIEQAVAAVQGWKLREEDQWVKDTLVDIFKGKKDYNAFLPRRPGKSEGAKS